MATASAPVANSAGLIIAAHLNPGDNDEYYAARHGGWICIDSNLITVPAASADQMFPSLPLNTRMIEMTVRGSDINITFDGVSPTSTVGHFYRQGNTYRFVGNASQLGIMSAYAIGGGDADIFYSVFTI